MLLSKGHWHLEEVFREGCKNKTIEILKVVYRSISLAQGGDL